MLSILRLSNIKLPPEEKDITELSKWEIFKIQNFWRRYENGGADQDDGAIEDFMELIINYPVSMSKREMTDTLKLLIALFYFYRPIGISERIRDVNEKQIMEALEKNWPATPSYEYLGIVFDKSKATIHEAIKEKEPQAKQLIEEGQLRREAKAIALKELIEEEKQKLRLERENNQRNSQTTEQTPKTP